MRWRVKQEGYVECPEMSGKTIQNLRIYPDTGDGTEVQIDFADGTSFTCSLTCQAAVKSTLYRPGIGSPEVLRKYEM